MKTVIRSLAAALLAIFVSLDSAGAAERIATFEKWEVVTFEEDGATGCYVMSQPEKAEGNYTQRGPVAAFVTHRPATGAIGIVSISAGYPYDEAKPVTIDIGGTLFSLYGRGETAWALDEDDPKLVAAMKAGARMVVTGISSRGTETRDTYSLSGFTKAYEAAGEACRL